MIGEQLELFTNPPAATFRFVTVCPWCGEPVEVSPEHEAGDRWDYANTWSYVAQKRHEAEAHPERAA